MKLTKIKVEDILRDYKNYEWVHQGVGFLRTYLDKKEKFRLHLWHPEIQVQSVEHIHTHNWDFTSRVVAGLLINKQFEVKIDPEGKYWRDTLGMLGLPVRCTLVSSSNRKYKKGDLYFERAETAHTVQLLGPCISIIERNFVEPEKVFSFRHINEKWADTIARPATEKELDYYIPQFKEMLCKI